MGKKLAFFSSLLAVVLLTGAGCLNIGNEQDISTSGPAGVFLSTDRGDTWVSVSAMPTNQGTKTLENMSVYSLFEDPQDAQGLYWGSREGGLFYSFDSGKSWKQSGAPLNVSMIRSVTIHPNDKCSIFATNGRQMFRTTDCVRSWEEVFIEGRSDVSITEVAFDPFHPENLYMTESDGALLKSVDGGVHWAILNTFKGYARSVVFDSNKEGLMFVTTLKNGLFRSRDFGETWTDLSLKLKEYTGALDYRRFLVYPGQAEEIFWISKYGILTSRNSGEEWEPVKLVTPPGSVDIYSFSVSRTNDSEMYYTSTNDVKKSTFYRTVDGGQNWETRKLPSKQIPTVLYSHPDNDGWIYLGFTIPPKN